MSEPDRRRFGRLFGRRFGHRAETDWDRSVLLSPRLAPARPELISDGSGLPFPPDQLTASTSALDPMDPAVAALADWIARREAKEASGGSWKRAAAPATPRLDGWRQLARVDGEVLFARGRPPQLLTVAMRQDGRRHKWACVAASSARPLRATRDGIRASGWRPDPSQETDPEATVLRIFVTEQTWAGGQRADGRLLEPDLHISAEELVLTMFVTPRPGFQTRSPNPETPVRVTLPHAVGSRRMIDGALYDHA